MTRDGDAAEQALGAAQAALGHAEDALAAGRPEEAAGVLAAAADASIDDTLLPRWVDTLSRANRFLSRHRDTVTWIEKRLADSPSPAARVQLLRARVGALRQMHRVQPRLHVLGRVGGVGGAPEESAEEAVALVADRADAL